MNLNEEMIKIRDKFVKNYKNDLLIDFKTMRVEYSEGIKDYIWFCRECGTNLMNKNNIRFKESYDNSEFNFYSEDKTVRAFNIHINSFKNGIFYGTIKSINYQKELSKNKEAEVNAKTVDVLIEYLDSEKNEKIFQKTLEYENFLPHKIIDSIGITKDRVISFVILNYK